MAEQSIKPRKTYLDVLRIIAIVLVVFNHTNENGFSYYAQARNSVFFPGYLLISQIDKIAVPLFFMISGALLIPKEESYKDVLKRFIKYAAILVCVSAIMLVYNYLKGKTSIFTFGEFVTGLYSNGTIVPYWYLYVYLAYILMLPFIRKIARGLKKKDVIWLVALYVLMSILFMADYTVLKGKYLHNSHFSLFSSLTYVFYPVLGYYFEHILPPERYTIKLFLILIVSSVIALAVLILLAYIWDRSIQCWETASAPSLIFIPTITVFVAVKMWFMKHPASQAGEKILAAIAGMVFGLYLFEEIFRTELGFILDAMKTVIHPYIACWIWVLIVCLIGGTVIFLIRLIPGVKKVI